MFFGAEPIFGDMLWAASGAAAPVIIHLIMRTKPRRIIFPAMRFVKKTHQANISKLRLKHLLLLLLRMLIVAVLAVLLARFALAEWSSAQVEDAPSAAVIVLDNSGSMTYELRRQKLLDRAKQQARELIASLPEGSKFAVLSTGGRFIVANFVGDRELAARQVDDLPSGCGSRPLAPAVAKAVAMLGQVQDLARREVYAFTDMTEQAWRDGSGAPATAEIDFFVVNCSRGEDTNVALGDLKFDSAVPAGGEVTVKTILASRNVGGDMVVWMEADGTNVARRSVHLEPGGTPEVELAFRPRKQGLVRGRVVLNNSDPLGMDNTRYFTVTVGPPARVLIVRDPTTIGQGDETSRTMGIAISAGAEWADYELITARRLDAAALKSFRVVMLTDVAAPADAQWAALERFVRDGGHVWVVPGPLLSVAAYNSAPAQKVMPAALGALEKLAEGQTFDTSQMNHPMLDPFTDPQNPPLTEVICLRRFPVRSTAPDATVVLKYADGTPAILLRQVGAGSVLLWNFSPLRQFANLAQLEHNPILAQRALRLLTAVAGAETAYPWGASASVAIPPELAKPVVTVRRPDARTEEPLVVGPRTRAVTFLADELGQWTVRLGDGKAGGIERGFSVNAEQSESDLGPADATRVKAMFPPGRVSIVTGLEDLKRNRQEITQSLDLMPPLLLGMLLMMIVESFFANRFYKTGQESAIAPEP